jgi:hypothetical protein
MNLWDHFCVGKRGVVQKSNLCGIINSKERWNLFRKIIFFRIYYEPITKNYL